MSLMVICILISLIKVVKIPYIIRKHWMQFGYFHILVVSLPLHNLCFETLYHAPTKDHISNSIKFYRWIEFWLAFIIMSLSICYSILNLSYLMVIKTRDPFSRTNNIYLTTLVFRNLI